VAFEALVSDPVETLRLLYRWLDLPPAPFDPQRLTVNRTRATAIIAGSTATPRPCHSSALAPHTLSPRIEQEILKNFGGSSSKFYTGPPQAEPKPTPGLLQKLGL
jgi:hypothetical protein